MNCVIDDNKTRKDYGWPKPSLARGPRQAGKASAVMAVGLVVLAAASGCDFTSTGTTVRLINNSDFAVEAIVLYHEDQLIPEFLLEEVGSELQYTIPAGETVSFSRDCDDLQAIRVAGDLQVLLGLGPSKTSNVYRDGTDFGCNDTITFTFTSDSLGKVERNLSF